MTRAGIHFSASLEVSPAVRAEWEKLARRWKNLLPRLQPALRQKMASARASASRAMASAPRMGSRRSA
jgi:hypothetical protein